MAQSKLPPSIRQRRLGVELRRMRNHAELTTTDAARLLGSSQSRVSSIESGSYAVSADRVRATARAYNCSDEALIAGLAMMTGGRSRGWWEEYRDILPGDWLDLAELEHHATGIRVGSVIHMPGLLQTREHARAVFDEVVPPLTPPEVEHRVSHRIKRQGVIYGDTPTPFTAIIHEAALRMGFGGTVVSRKQLEHLVEMSERKHITVLTVPFGAGAFPSSGHGIIYLEGDVPKLDTVQLDTDHGPAFVDTEPHLVKYRTVLDRMHACALGPKESRDLIHHIAQST
ncbi:helix-turn-helix domain-containing protein [Streptomyces mayteni]